MTGPRGGAGERGPPGDRGNDGQQGGLAGWLIGSFQWPPLPTLLDWLLCWPYTSCWPC